MEYKEIPKVLGSEKAFTGETQDVVDHMLNRGPYP